MAMPFVQISRPFFLHVVFHPNDDLIKSDLSDQFFLFSFIFAWVCLHSSPHEICFGQLCIFLWFISGFLSFRVGRLLYLRAYDGRFWISEWNEIPSSFCFHGSEGIALFLWISGQIWHSSFEICSFYFQAFSVGWGRMMRMEFMEFLILSQNTK